jgi:hypothetical protein
MMGATLAIGNAERRNLNGIETGYIRHAIQQSLNAGFPHRNFVCRRKLRNSYWAGATRRLGLRA